MSNKQREGKEKIYLFNNEVYVLFEYIFALHYTKNMFCSSESV